MYLFLKINYSRSFLLLSILFKKKVKRSRRKPMLKEGTIAYVWDICNPNYRKPLVKKNYRKPMLKTGRIAH
jgi:hypothetical protein